MPRFAGSRGNCSAPASPCKKGAQREHRSEKTSLVDAERGCERAVFGRGADQHAESRALENPPERNEHERADGEKEEVVRGNRSPEDIDGTLQPGRARSQQILGTPQRKCDVANDQHDAERGGELQQLRRCIDPLEDQHLDGRHRAAPR
jgi:hypothetical protein